MGNADTIPTAASVTLASHSAILQSQRSPFSANDCIVLIGPNGLYHTFVQVPNTTGNASASPDLGPDGEVADR
eukprot:CAMPEP_0184294464 /NCGR_PEP_ID=MMETSP1049-20130417/5653_1 /TAXON_ID=77928 /ORGANISM="Proteomonas sulcata, Strain CCMP704" /LENGTH=72 /DNA_ID=CAMNT_0026602759 /DNA_START=341 /DNA_END=559 /DNA_ORIENTATION=+